MQYKYTRIIWESIFQSVLNNCSSWKAVSHLSSLLQLFHPNPAVSFSSSFSLSSLLLPHPLLFPSPPLPDSLPPCNYHLRLQLKETTIKRAGEGDRGAARGRERGWWRERQRGEFNERFVHTHTYKYRHTRMNTLIAYAVNTTLVKLYVDVCLQFWVCGHL